MRGLSTEARVASAFVAVLGGVLTVAFISVHVLLREDATRELDAGLRARVASVSGLVGPDPGTASLALLQTLAMRDPTDAASAPPLTSVRATDGTLVASSLPGDDPSLLPADLQRSLQAGHDDLRTVALPGGQSMRVYSAPIRDDSGQVVAVVQAGGRLGPLIGSTDRVEAVLASVALGGLILGAVVAIAVVRVTFEPLRHVLSFLERGRPFDGTRLEPSGSSDMRLLATTLTDLVGRFEHELEDRQRFMNTVSHDLRTPLTSLHGTLEVLMLEPGLDRDIVRRLRVLRDECGRLLRLSENLLLLGRAEIGFTLARRDTDLQPLVWEVGEQVRWSRPQCDVEAEAPDAVLVSGDPDRLRQAVLNLIDNSVRHGKAPVMLRLRATAQEACIEVVDHGPGLGPGAADLFARPLSPWEGPPTRGLGLAVVRWVAEGHDGRLEYARDAGATVFRFHLPLLEPTPAAITAEAGRERIAMANAFK